MYRQFIIDLIDLPDFELIRMSKRSQGWTAVLEPKSRCFLCPICGAKSTTHKRGKKRILRHRVIPHFGFISVDVPVLHQQCTNCQAIWSIKWEGIPSYGHVTNLFKETIVSLCHCSSLQSVSEKYEVPYTTLERWYYEQAEATDEAIHSHRQDPYVVCLDDFAIQKGHQYAISLVDHKTGEVCQLSKGRKREAIQAALKEWPYARPEVVVTDLAPGMVKTVQEVWPKTKVAADPFHVIQLFTQELDHFRKKLTKDEKSQMKRRKVTRLLTTHPLKLTFKEYLQLEEWLARHNDLHELYQALQGIRRIYKQSQTDLSERAINQWMNRYLFSECTIVHRIAKTVLQWKKPIIHAIHYKVSNGKIEGINNKIKLIKRRAFGYRNMHHFELRVKLETVN